MTPWLHGLETRVLPTSSPFGPSFNSGFAQLLADYDLPQASIAVLSDGQIATTQQTNTAYFNSQQITPPPLDAGTLFRIGSISKTVTAAAIGLLVQNNPPAPASPSLLDQDAFALLGYYPGEVLHGYDPMSGAAVQSKPLPAELFDVTVGELLQMTGGFYDDIPLKSPSFSDVPAGNVMYKQGSYAALAFAGPPPYDAGAATISEIINYELYEISLDPGLMSTAPGTAYNYNDFGYGVLGVIVAKLGGSSASTLGQQYGDYVQQNILGPMGIVPPSADTTASAVMALGNTLEDQALPGETEYFPQTPLESSIFPESGKTTVPYYKMPVDASPPYGGDFDLSSHFGNGAFVANPTALVTFFSDLGSAFGGSMDSPLLPATVQEMAAQPVVPGTVDHLPANEPAGGWFAMGWSVTAYGGLGLESWKKDGLFNDAGTTALMVREADGTVWAAVFNGGIAADQDGPFESALEALVQQALYQAPVAAADHVATTAGIPIAIGVLANDTDPNAGGILLPESVVVTASPVNGTASVNLTTGTINYTPAAGFTGTDTFSYTVSDNYGLVSNVATVTITVTPYPPPIAVGSRLHERPIVKVLDGYSGAELFQFDAYSTKFRGGVRVAVGDVTGSGVAEIITAPGPGGIGRPSRSSTVKRGR